MLDLLRKLLGQQILNYYHLVMAIIANFVYGFPSRQLHVIGVTGTDGKTTTVNLIASMLRAAGQPTAHLSTVGIQIADQVYSKGLHTTTPSPFQIQRLLREAVRAQVKYVVLEATSHALDQHRTDGIRFETAVLTNISHEHLDYHKTLEAYTAAKARLFRNVKYGVMNMDDQSFKTLFPRFSRRRERKLFLYSEQRQATVWSENVKQSFQGSIFLAHTPRGKMEVTLGLPGSFNISNALAAIAVGEIYQLPQDKIAGGLKGLKSLPGRMELIEGGRVMVDFAHTPNALKKLLEFLRPQVSGKLIVVFGSAGERDHTKRPMMGSVADQFADVIVLTREDNRSEDLREICAQIAAGIKSKLPGKTSFVIPDRREAIRSALHLAKGEQDLVVVTGKGHEQSLNVDGQEIPWDDRAVVREEIEKNVKRSR